MVTRTSTAFAVHYVATTATLQSIANTSPVLGVIGYGAERPEFLSPACPFITTPLASTDGAPAFEIWTASTPCRPLQSGRVNGAASDDLAFGAITLDETTGIAFEDEVERAYLQIFNFMAQSGFTAPIRFWNYLTSIMRIDDGLERYRRFNIGRHAAFAARLQQKLPPAASGVGGLHGRSMIYFLAARQPARPIENPRQISAYQYPEIYGPRSPSFSRASIYAQNGTQTLFISGTASIVGHETRHLGDLPAQIAETATNLRALIDAAAIAPGQSGWALKIYLLNPSFRDAVKPVVDAMFGPDCEVLYLQGEICRPGLLLEIEAVHCAVEPG